MKHHDQDAKVETDYKMSRQFSGIVYAVIGLMILIVLVFLLFFLKAQNKVVPPQKIALSARLHSRSVSSEPIEQPLPPPDCFVVEGERS